MPINSNIPSEDSITPITNILTGSLRTIFEHSAYNVLVNNIIGARQSSYYFDLDYSYNLILPVNIDLIQSQSAAIATVQDSNYSSFRNISSRYLGSKLTSARYNFYTPYSLTASFDYGSDRFWEGDISYGKNAAIDLYTNYFAYFEEVQDAFPKASLGSKIVISKLIDKEGKIIPLDGRNVNLFDVSNIFKPNKKIFLYYTETPSGSLSEIQNVLTKSVDESGFLYTNVAFYKPTQTLPSVLGQPLLQQEDNKIFYSLLDSRAISGVYDDREIYGYNSLIAQNQSSYENNKLYFYYGISDSSSYGVPPSPYTSTGYFLGMGLLLRNFYPNTGEQYSNYRLYPWIRFEHISGGAQNYNLNINTDLLPIQKGDRFRIYDSTEAGFNEVYSYDKDIFFIQNAVGSSIKYTFYDSEIIDINFTLPTTINILTGTSTSSFLNENLFISSDSASIYSTSDRFSTAGNLFPISSSTRILPALNENSIDITPGTYVAGQHDESLGYGISFKKLYKLKDFSSFNDSGATVQYKYWALGTSGSLFRSTNNLIFDEVNLNLHPSCSLNSLFFLPDSTISNDPNVNYFSTPNISYRSSFKRGYIFVVGDSGSIFYSSDYGNTFNQAYFPRTDINLHDVYYFKDYHKFNPSLGNETTDYLMVVGTSGSIYVTSGSSKSTQYSGGSVSYDSIDSVNLFNNWINGYSYSTLWNYVGSTSTAFPSQQKRENLTITRILPYYSINASTNNAGTADNTLFLFYSNSGSIFLSANSNAEENYAIYSDGNVTGFELGLALDSAIYRYIAPSSNPIFTTQSILIDGIITGSVYPNDTFLLGQSGFEVQNILIDRTGYVYLNPIFSSLADNYGLIYNNTTEAPFNEIRSLNTINYNSNQLELQCWIPTSTGKLISQSLSKALLGGTQSWRLVDPIAYFSYTSSSLGRILPSSSFYSIIEVNDYNPYNPYSSLYVQLTFRDNFTNDFYNPVGSSVFPYGVNPDFSNYIQNGNYTGTRQAFRIYRKYSNEQYVLTKEYTNDGKGFLIPENYNPNLNYIELAKKTGLII